MPRLRIMTENEPAWNPNDWNPTYFRYEQIADWVAERIHDGRLPARTVLSEVALQTYFGVGRETIRRAFAVLRERGLIVTKRGRGSVVLDRPHGDVLG